MKSIVSALFVIAVGALLAYTNPTLESYQQYLRQSILKQAKRRENPVEQALGAVLGGVASGVIGQSNGTHGLRVLEHLRDQVHR